MKKYATLKTLKLLLLCQNYILSFNFFFIWLILFICNFYYILFYILCLILINYCREKNSGGTVWISLSNTFSFSLKMTQQYICDSFITREINVVYN